MKVRVGSRGTIVIPKEIRDKYGISEGDTLEVSLRDKSIVFSKDKIWEKLHGCMKGLTTAEDIEKEMDKEERAWEKRLGQ